MEFIFGLLLILLALSLPIFYIWGVVSFFRVLLGGGAAKKPDNTEGAPVSESFMREMRAIALENPDLTLHKFLGIEDVPDETATDKQPEADADEIDKMMREAIGRMQAEADEREAYPAQAADEEAAQDPDAAPSPSGSNWFQDNAINLLLYLGAFLIVAAVSLFVGFQWNSLGGVVRFGLVVLFTLGWYAGGVVIAQTLQLETPSIAFITIGALLTPFCGVAWQQFVVGSDNLLGITWLVTSLISTVIYLGLSMIYRRRFFTYFGSLSTLAMVLALVEINNAPSEYFILTATLTALLLLLVRLGLRFAPEGERDYFARDIENASLGTLLVSVVIGLLAISDGAVPFYSIEVFAVLFVVTVYAWIYVSLRLFTVTLVAAQWMTVYTVNHLLIVLGLEGLGLQLIDAGVHLALLVGINVWLRDRDDKRLYHRVNYAALGLSGMIYWWVAISGSPEFISALFALGVGLHAAYVAAFHDVPWLYYGTAIAPYFGALHLIEALELNEMLSFGVMHSIGVVELLLAYTLPPVRPLRRAFSHVGIMGLGLWHLMVMIDTTVYDPTALSWIALAIITPLAYIALSVYELRAPERLLRREVHLITAGVLLLSYLSAGLETDATVMMASGLGFGVAALLAYFHVGRAWVMIGPTLAVYAVTVHLLQALDAPNPAYPLVIALLSAALYLGVDYVSSALPKSARTATKITVIVSLATTYCGVFWYLVLESLFSADQQLLHIAGWVAGYTLFGLLFTERNLPDGRLRDFSQAASGLTLYWWHIFFLIVFEYGRVFEDIQWFAAALAVVLVMLGLRDTQRSGSKSAVVLYDGLAAVSVMLITLVQISESGDLIYFLLGMAYSLGFVALGVWAGRRFTRQVGIVSLVAVVLFQSSDFLLGLPRWLIVGVVGFGLIGTAIYLSIRSQQRSGKREPEA